MPIAPRPADGADVLYDIRITPEEVILGAEPVPVDIRVLVTGPGHVAGELVPPFAPSIPLEFDTRRTHPDWHARYVFRPDDPIGVWRLRLDVAGTPVETEFEVVWSELRAPVRIGDVEVRPREIEEGEPVVVWGRLEVRAERRGRDVWEPFPGQPVLLGFQAEESGERVYLGRAVTGEAGVFELTVEPWESGLLRPEPWIVAGPEQDGEAPPWEVEEIPITVFRAAGSAKVKVHRIKRHGGAKYRHHVFVTVNSLPAGRGKVQIYYKKTNRSTPVREGTAGGGVDGWFTVDTRRRRGGLWQAAYAGPPSARGRWIRGV